MPPSRPAPKLRELLARVEALEERVARVEKGRPPPGDGRSSARRAGLPRGERCPGCGLPLRRRRGRCAECGRPLEA